MTPAIWVNVAAIVVTLLISFAAAIWVGGIYFSKQFKEIRERNSLEFTDIKVELTRVATTVSPYAQDIARLSTQQQRNSLAIAEMRSWGDRLASLERQMENVPRR